MQLIEHTIPVRMTNTPYAVHVCPGLLEDVGPRLARLSPSKRVMMMTDIDVGPLYAARVRKSCEAAGLTVVAEHALPTGESNKTFTEIDRALGTLLAAKIERTTPLIALGGGVVGDMAGFTAAILVRGVPFVQVPTSLLAMVDASVGGKTGVNHAAGKNMVGAFHQPLAVFADPDLLKTLPRREFISGLAECIKHDCIRDREGFAELERNLDKVLQLDPATLAELVGHNVHLKARIVEADPFEQGERAHLNFGHTYGHGIEKVSNFAYHHGEAVALGMVAASYTATKLGTLPEADRGRIVELLRRAGLPVGGLTLDIDRVIQAMAFDKKVKQGRIRFVILDGIGKAVIRDDVPPTLIREALETLRG